MISPLYFSSSFSLFSVISDVEASSFEYESDREDTTLARSIPDEICFH
jgi:hypothetical protein